MTIPLTHQHHHRVIAFLPPDTDAWLIAKARKSGLTVMQLATEIIVEKHAAETATDKRPTQPGEIA